VQALFFYVKYIVIVWRFPLDGGIPRERPGFLVIFCPGPPVSLAGRGPLSQEGGDRGINAFFCLADPWFSQEIL
jgi:hypothetical protein